MQKLSLVLVILLLFIMPQAGSAENMTIVVGTILRNGTERNDGLNYGTLSQIEACNLPLLKLPLRVISGTSSG